VTHDIGLKYDVKDRVATILLDRPPANTLSVPVVQALIDLYTKAKEDRGVGAVVLRSALPKRFCGGYDLDLAKGVTAVEMRDFLDKLYLELFDVQHRLGKPSIAAVHGAARGAGITLAINCDMIVAADTAHFAYAEINVGLIPGIHLVHLARIVGRHKAFELLFSGRVFDAAEAKEMQLLNKVVPETELPDAAHEFAQMFTDKAPMIMRIGKNAFMRANDLDFRRNVEAMAETLIAQCTVPDVSEGFRAFLEKRAAKWPSLEL
jgi:enoyl-CoA hydratase